MGFRFRKTFGKGPFKMTVSKSGVGYSVGGKGFRVTKKAGGGTRTTANIPGTGISYSTDSKKKTTKTTSVASKSAQTSASAKSSGGCLTSCLWFLGICLIIGLISKYWKVLLIGALALAAAYIAFKAYKKPHSESFEEPTAIPEEVPAIEEPEKTKEEVKVYEVAGVSYYLDSLKSMMVPNYLYKYKKQELIDICQTDEPIYKETVEDGKLEIVPEPNNAHDPNAIKVLINGNLIGYIPAKDCEHLLEVIKNGNVVSTAYIISGGKYKMVSEDYDFSKDKSTYSVEYGEDDYAVTLFIREKLCPVSKPRLDDVIASINASKSNHESTASDCHQLVITPETKKVFEPER